MQKMHQNKQPYTYAKSLALVMVLKTQHLSIATRPILTKTHYSTMHVHPFYYSTKLLD